jgi:hypothetical protein
MSNSGNQKSVLLGAVLIGALAGNVGAKAASNDYASLLALFQDWRAFERPSMRSGAPDYRGDSGANTPNSLPIRRAVRRSIPANGRSRNRSTTSWCAPR